MVNSIGGKIITFLLGVILARLLSPSDFGVVGMTAIFFALANILIDSGFASALVRKLNMSDKDTSTVFYFNLVVSAVLSLLIIVSSSAIANYLNAAILTDIIKVSAITLFVGALGSVQIALLVKKVDFKTIAILTIVSQSVSGALGVVLAYNGFGPWALVWQSLTAASFKTILVWIISKWRPKLLFSFESLKSMFGFGANLAINNVLDTFFRDGIGMIIGKYYSTDQLGYYTRGQNTAQIPSSFLFGIIGQVTFPVLSKIQNEDVRLLSIFRKFMKMFSLLIFFFMILLIAIAKPLTIILFTEKWLDSVIFLQLFSFSFLFYHIHALNGNYLLVKGRSDWILKKEIINKTFKILVLVSMISKGVVFITIAFCCSTVFDLIVNTLVTGYLFSYGLSRQLKDVSVYFILSIFCCLPAFLSSYLISNAFLSLPIGVISSCILYISVLIYRKDCVFEELINISPFKKYAHFVFKC